MSNGTNYSEWSAATMYRLMEKGIWSSMKDNPLGFKKFELGEAPFVGQETSSSASYAAKVTPAMILEGQKALGIIGRTIMPQFLEHISQASNAADAWE
jgi:hypothetical protein